MIEKPTEPIAAMYAWMIPHLQTVGRQFGYAIAVHGSMARDLDLIAVPWTTSASPAEILVAGICDAVGGTIRNDPQHSGNRHDQTTSNPAERPHGRRAWTIRFAGHRFYIDLSVMPVQSNISANGLEQQLAAALEREKELIAWKESMLSVTPPIQEIGQEIGVELGDTIHDKILPWIKASKERERLLRKCVELLLDFVPYEKPELGPLPNWIVEIKQRAQACLEKMEGMN